ncbi:MAG: hypothetical protein R3F49_24765 [Planctomycetota bacterium]
MKCPKCSHKQQRKVGMRCKQCSYDFVFDPKQGLKLSDRAFEAVISRANARETAWFTREQLYLALAKRGFEAARRTRRTGIVCLVASGLALAVLWSGFIRGAPRLPLTIACGAAALFAGLVVRATSRPTPPSRPDFDAAVDLWQKRRGPIPMLLSAPRLHEAEQYSEADLHDYGVERVLVVQRDLLVDMFVMNDWHTEQRALVLSMTGYPRYLLPVAQRCCASHPTSRCSCCTTQTQQGSRWRPICAPAACCRSGTARSSTSAFAQTT